MQTLHNINVSALLDTIIGLGVAFVLGGAIGFERQYRQRTAGLRTNVLVAVGAAIFVNLALRLNGSEGGARVTSYVVSGIGFLGAGVIMREQGNVRGLNTAATLWGSAAVGAAAGACFIPEAVLSALFVLAANTLLRPIVQGISRYPPAADHEEAPCMVSVIAERAHLPMVMAWLEEELARQQLAVPRFGIHTLDKREVEIEAQFSTRHTDSPTMDALVKQLDSLPAVRKSFWSIPANT